MKSVPTDPEHAVRVRDQQSEIPGTEQPRIGAIEDASDAYDEKRKIWQGLGEELTNAKAKLTELMRLHAAEIVNRDGDTLAYLRGDYTVTLVPGNEKLKVKIAGGEEEAAN